MNDNTEHSESGAGVSYVDEFAIHPHADRACGPAFPEFDWDELSRLLGEQQEELAERDYEALGQAMKELILWVVGKKHNVRLVGRRVFALAWVMDPSMFDGTPSAAELSQRIGCHKATLSEDCAEASRRFGIRNRSQRHAGNFKPVEKLGLAGLPAMPVAAAKREAA